MIESLADINDNTISNSIANGNTISNNITNNNPNSVDKYNIITNPRVIYAIMYILLTFVIICIYYGYSEEHKNYAKIYKPAIGKINNVELEENTNTILSNLTYGLRNYSSVVLYRIRVTYEYKIDNNVYTGHFYNNSKHEKYEELGKIKSYWAQHKLNPHIKIYYSQLTNSTSSVNFNNSKKTKVNFYYGCGLTFIVLLIAYIVFSVLCVFS